MLSSVNCSATAARAIADHFSRQTNPHALADYPERRRRGRAHARHRLRHGHRAAWACRSSSARSPATPRTPTSPACSWSAWAARRTRSTPGWRTASLREGETLRVFNIQDTGGTRKTVAQGHRADQGDAAARPTRCSASRAARRTSPSACSAAAPTATRASAPTRRSAPRSTCWCAHGGTRDPLRDARDLRRRAPAHAPRRAPRGRREADRAHPLVGALHRASTTAR